MRCRKFGFVLSCIYVLLNSIAYAEQAAERKFSVCITTKEYITTLQYLRDRKELSISEQDAQKVAEKVAAHCDGAAARFIRITSALSVGGLSGANSIELGIRYAGRSDAATSTFSTIFKMAFLADELDLDLKAAIEIAESLSDEFDASVEHAKNDFISLIRFCSRTKGLDLPKPTCARLAAKIAKFGQNYDRGVSESFLRIYSFLTESKKGPAIPLHQAIKQSEALVANGPLSAENFILAYKFGMKEKGLALAASGAFDFANRLAEMSAQKTVEKEAMARQDSKKDRTPASTTH